jgi:hypothetical protein
MRATSDATPYATLEHMRASRDALRAGSDGLGRARLTVTVCAIRVRGTAPVVVLAAEEGRTTLLVMLQPDGWSWW